MQRNIIRATAFACLLLPALAILLTCSPRRDSCGLRCPSGKACRLFESSCSNGPAPECVEDAAIKACEGQGVRDGDTCVSAAGAGICRQGVCRVSECQNGFVDPGEACDDCNAQDGDGCSKDCHSNETCGNGIVDLTAGEDCDCSTSTTMATDPACNGFPNHDQAGYCSSLCVLNCGDGELDQGEQCDGTPPIGEYCIDHYYDMGALGCSDTCSGITTDCCVSFEFQSQQLDKTWQISSIWGGDGDTLHAAGLLCSQTNHIQCLLSGAEGLILRYQDGTWRKVATPKLPTMTDITGDSSGRLYAVGASATILYSDDGETWHDVAIETRYSRASYFFTSVQVAEDGRVVVVGFRLTSLAPVTTTSGVLWIRGQDGRWVEQEAFPTINFFGDVWIVDGHIFAVGEASSTVGESVIAHHDGSSWDFTYFPDGTGSLYSVAGTSRNNIVAVGDHGVIMHYSGNEWTIVRSGSPEQHPLVGAVALEGNRILLLGMETDALVYDPDATQPLSVFTKLTRTGAFRSAWARGDELVIAGSNGRVLRRHDTPAGWSLLRELDGNISDIWVADSGEMVLALKDTLYPVLIHDSITNTGPWNVYVLPGENHIRKLWGSSPDDLYGISYDAVWHWNGMDWRRIYQNPMEGDLINIWGFRHDTGDLDLFVAGAHGAILHFNSTSGHWHPMTTGVDVTLLALWGSSMENIYAVGSDRIVLRYDGQTWITVYGPEAALHFSSVWGSDPDHVFIAGDGAQILHCSTKECRWQDAPFHYPLADIWGRSAEDVYAAGSQGMVYHYDGSTWSPVRQVDSVERFSNIWGYGDRILFTQKKRFLALTLPPPDDHCTAARKKAGRQ